MSEGGASLGKHTLGELCVGGDWACAHGDLSGLANIAEELAARAQEPLHCELVELVRVCRCAPDQAPAMWFGLKPHLQDGTQRMRI